MVDQAALPVYVRIAETAQHLRELGMSDRAIARALDVSDKTVAEASAFSRRAVPREYGPF
jgi:predicted transcriptional regulator